MNLDEILKRILWAIIFAIVLLGLYHLFSSLGVL